MTAKYTITRRWGASKTAIVLEARAVAVTIVCDVSLQSANPNDDERRAETERQRERESLIIVSRLHEVYRCAVIYDFQCLPTRIRHSNQKIHTIRCWICRSWQWICRARTRKWLIAFWFFFFWFFCTCYRHRCHQTLISLSRIAMYANSSDINHLSKTSLPLHWRCILWQIESRKIASLMVCLDAETADKLSRAQCVRIAVATTARNVSNRYMDSGYPFDEK